MCRLQFSFPAAFQHLQQPPKHQHLPRVYNLTGSEQRSQLKSTPCTNGFFSDRWQCTKCIWDWFRIEVTFQRPDTLTKGIIALSKALLERSCLRTWSCCTGTALALLKGWTGCQERKHCKAALSILLHIPVSSKGFFFWYIPPNVVLKHKPKGWLMRRSPKRYCILDTGDDKSDFQGSVIAQI